MLFCPHKLLACCFIERSCFLWWLWQWHCGVGVTLTEISTKLMFLIFVSVVCHLESHEKINLTHFWGFMNHQSVALLKKNMFCVLVSAVTVCFYIILAEFRTIWVFVFTWSQWSFFPHKQTNVMCCFPFNLFNMIWNVLLGQMWRWCHQDCDWRTWLLRTQICLNSNVIGHILHVIMGRNLLYTMHPNH